MYCSGVNEPAVSRLRETEPASDRDVESRGDLAILAASDGIDPRLVGRPCTAGALGDVQTDTRHSAHCLIPQAALRDGRFTNSIEELSRLLVSDQLFEWKTSKVRHRRLLSKAERGAGDDERLECPETARAEGEGSSFPKMQAPVTTPQALARACTFPVPVPLPLPSPAFQALWACPGFVDTGFLSSPHRSLVVGRAAIAD